jgi:tRNA(Ile)-lysidine synthase
MSVEELEAAVRADGLLARSRPVLVLYSGGRDSSCLLDLAVRIAGAEAVAALHVNYRLRAAAATEERHCRERCERLGVALNVRRAEGPATGNVQAWARELRYELAAELALPRGADIAAAHTAQDQVETILYRLASSPSRRALLGMEARSGAIVRPLLAFSREQITAYCRGRGLDWVEDQSNASQRYARNRVRAQLLPALRAVHPAAERNVLALAALLRQESEVLEELVERELGGCASIPQARLGELPPALARLIVQRLADAAVGRPAPGAGGRVQELLALRSGSLHLPHGVSAHVRRGRLSFAPTSGGARTHGAVVEEARGARP